MSTESKQRHNDLFINEFLSGTIDHALGLLPPKSFDRHSSTSVFDHSIVYTMTPLPFL